MCLYYSFVLQLQRFFNMAEINACNEIYYIQSSGVIPGLNFFLTQAITVILLTLGKQALRTIAFTALFCYNYALFVGKI